ncbi:hypothetical protein M9Y10_019876 [Tritrichomonas musculus]|uniref:Uncharacterized protein n=1 Tax=Tritrichomonas musculus TaxID=1915356 RepID=A0ABR2HHI6_9EUKA
MPLMFGKVNTKYKKPKNKKPTGTGTGRGRKPKNNTNSQVQVNKEQAQVNKEIAKNLAAPIIEKPKRKRAPNGSRKPNYSRAPKWANGVTKTLDNTYINPADLVKFFADHHIKPPKQNTYAAYIAALKRWTKSGKSGRAPRTKK